MSLGAFQSAIAGIPCSTDPAVIAARSRDAYAVSPMLRRSLRGRHAEAVVSPRDKADLSRVVAAAHAHRVGLTPRGAGTANYGQSVPLRGGVLLDLSALTGILWLRPGAVRARAGTLLGEIEAAANATGQELRFFPTTIEHATLGGFIAGGTGGVGSINHGVLRDAGNITAVEAMSAEAVPRLVECRGAAARAHHHSYGTTGLLTEVELPLAPRQDWRECLFGVVGYVAAAGFALALARADGIAKKLVSAYEWPIAHWMVPLRPLVPEGLSLVPCLIARPSMEACVALAAEHGASLLSQAAPGEGAYGQPLHRFAFGHTTLQVKKSRPRITEVEGFFRAPDLLDLIARVHARLGGLGPLRLEFRRWDGDLVASGAPFIDYADAPQIADVVRLMQGQGVKVANPHANTVRGVGKKDIGPREIALKREMDPLGLLNPGRFEADEAQDAVIENALPTHGWSAAASE